MKRFYAKGLTAVLAAMLAVTGCSTGAGKEGAADASPKASASSGGQVLTIANSTDIESFDAHNNNNTQSEAVLVNVFDYLIKNDSSQKKVPSLATSWEKVDDTTWRFKLRQGVKFHNGDPFTAADVKFSLERVAKDGKLKQNTYYKNFKEVKIVDDYTVDIITTEPDPLMLNRLSRMGADMLPSKYIQEKGVDAFLKEPVGTGPYKFSKWTKDDRIELVKNADYFGGAPKWDKVVFRSIPEASTRVSELIAGGVDIAAGVPATDIKRIEGSGNKVAQATIQRVLHIIMRTTPGTVTADPKVREAMDLAINNKAIIDSVAGGAGIPTRTSVTPGNFGADPSLYNQYVYDLDRAKALLKEAGYANGGPEVTFSSSVVYKEIAEMTAAMLTEAGFKVNLEILEASKFSEKLNSKKFNELFLLGVGNSLFDASNNYNRFKFANAKGETDYNNPEVEQLLQAADKNMSPEDREKQFQKVQQILAVDRPTIYLYQMKGIYGIGSKVDYTPRLDEMYFAEDVTPKK